MPLSSSSVSSSSSDAPFESSASRTPRPTTTLITASRFMTTMRRSFSSSPAPRKRHTDVSTTGMYSTPEERRTFTPSRFRYPDASAIRPTIEQISMGLHLSRTPHLRPGGKLHQRHSAPPSPGSRPITKTHNYKRDTVSSSLVLPPPPARSSLKKPSASLSASSTSTPAPGLLSPSASSQSTLTVTSMGPSTPRSGSSIRLRMSRLLGRSVSSSTSSSGMNSPVSSSSEAVPRKAVRFSSSVLGLDEVASQSSD